MNPLFAQLYSDIVNHVINANLGIKFYDIWNDQLTFFENSLPFERPALFIEFTPMNASNRSNGSQFIDGTVRLHLVQDIYKDTYQSIYANGATGNHTESIAVMNEIYGKTQALQRIMQNKAFEDYMLLSFDRISIEPDLSFQNLIDTIQEYSFQLVDNDTYTGNTTPVQLTDIVVQPNTVPAPTPNEPIYSIQD